MMINLMQAITLTDEQFESRDREAPSEAWSESRADGDRLPDCAAGPLRRRLPAQAAANPN